MTDYPYLTPEQLDALEELEPVGRLRLPADFEPVPFEVEEDY